MAGISRAALFGKLNQVGYKAIEAATVFCKMRGNPYVELVHWIHQILQLRDSDLHRIIKQFNLDPSRLAADITESLDKLPRGSTTMTDLSSHVEEAVERGWVLATLQFGEAQVRTGYLVAGVLQTRVCATRCCRSRRSSTRSSTRRWQTNSTRSVPGRRKSR
jgi:type VI secretion system protein VasG